jgi:hypothetical protein
MPPPKLTEGMPDLDSIKRQKAAYEQQIESELKRQAGVGKAVQAAGLVAQG